MNTRGRTFVLTGLFLTISGYALAQDAAAGGDPVAGEQVYKKCLTCHRIGPGAKSLIGPVHNGLIGRQAGTYPGFAYSSLNKAAGDAGLKWTEDNIFEYLPDPSAFLKKYLTDHGKADAANGITKMVFKLPSEKERKDVIAYIKKFQDVQ
jgi:cytochrome c